MTLILASTKENPNRHLMHPFSDRFLRRAALGFLQMKHDALDYSCPQCLARAGNPCVNASGRKIKGAHLLRSLRRKNDATLPHKPTGDPDALEPITLVHSRT
jgi:hypothetical protein